MPQPNGVWWTRRSNKSIENWPCNKWLIAVCPQAVKPRVSSAAFNMLLQTKNFVVGEEQSDGFWVSDNFPMRPPLSGEGHQKEDVGTQLISPLVSSAAISLQSEQLKYYGPTELHNTTIRHLSQIYLSRSIAFMLQPLLDHETSWSFLLPVKVCETLSHVRMPWHLYPVHLCSHYLCQPSHCPCDASHGSCDPSHGMMDQRMDPQHTPVDWDWRTMLGPRPNQH
jgi:hypothetical protein